MDLENVVNAVSAYVEKGGMAYTAAHVQGAGNIATACQLQNVARLVHISGIGADPTSQSPYIRAQGLGELAVRKAFPNATVLRPGVIFVVLGVADRPGEIDPISNDRPVDWR
jgi:NADH dehydrogenase